MEKKFDVIIPVAGKDVRFVHRVAKYIRENLFEADTIYIITNISNFPQLKRKLSKQERVEILDEDQLVKGLSLKKVKEFAYSNTNCLSVGWYYQQFLKLGFSLSKYAKKYYLSWDADTIPISKISFFEDNKPLFTQKSEYNENYFVTISKLLSLKKLTSYSFIAEHMLFDVAIMKEMLLLIDQSNSKGSSPFEKILLACDFDKHEPAFSEFETYGTYVLSHYPEKYATRQLRTFRRGGLIKGRYISDQMLNKLSIDLDTISFEIRDEPSFPYNIPNKWWKLKNICSKIISNPKIVYRRIMLGSNSRELRKKNK